MQLLQAAETVEAAPDTFEALKAGKVSTREAKAIGAAEAADPAAGRSLLAAAESRSTKETENDAARIVAAASTETPDAKAERHRKTRRIFHGVNADGMGFGGWLAPIAEHTRFVAQLEAEQQQVFAEARARGDREPMEAYAADAFFRIIDRAAPKTPGTPAGTDRAEPCRWWRCCGECGGCGARRGGRGLVVHEDDRPGRPHRPRPRPGRTG